MSQTPSNSHVGKVIYHEEYDSHEADVVLLKVSFHHGPDGSGVVTELSLLTSTVMPNGESKIILQHFGLTEKPTTVELDPETLTLLSREASIVLEKRIRTARRTTR